MPSLEDASRDQACCVVRDNLVVIGGEMKQAVLGGPTLQAVLGSVKMPAEGEDAFTGQPPLTCGGVAGAVAIVVNESGSTTG